MNQHQLQIIDYLREENCVLREQLGGRRVRLNDDQRRRLAAKAKGLGWRLLAEVATIVTPETLLAWHRATSPNRSPAPRPHYCPAGRRQRAAWRRSAACGRLFPIPRLPRQR